MIVHVVVPHIISKTWSFCIICINLILCYLVDSFIQIKKEEKKTLMLINEMKLQGLQKNLCIIYFLLCCYLI